MIKKNLMSQIDQSLNNLTIQDLPIDLVELSEEVLSQVRGGRIANDVYTPWQLDPIHPGYDQPILPVTGCPGIGYPVTGDPIPVIGNPFIHSPLTLSPFE
jgi:hypothetical protein